MPYELTQDEARRKKPQASDRRPSATAMLLRADAAHSFERRAERERAAVAHLLSYRTDGCVRFAQQVGGKSQSPSGEERHRRFAHDVVKAASERRPRHADLGREGRDRPWLGGIFVHETDRTPNDRIALGSVPRWLLGLGSSEPSPQHPDEQQIEQAVEHGRLTGLVLHDFVAE